MIVTNYKEISALNLSLYKPVKIRHDLYKLALRYKNIPLIIQTPKVHIFNSPKINNYGGKLTINFGYSDIEEKKIFNEKIKLIEKFIQSSIRFILKQYISDKFSSSRLRESIYSNSENTNLYMNLHLDKKIISIYDPFKNEQNINYLSSNSSLINIIYIDSIWVKENEYGIKWGLLQSKVFPSIEKLEECIIEDKYEDQPHKHYYNIPTCNIINDTQSSFHKKNINSDKENHDVYGKYAKMKRLNIPIERINQKLIMDGLNPNEFRDFMDGKQINIEIKKPLNLFSEMKSQLKKSEPMKKSKVKSKKSNSFIPSVEEIRRMLRLIKKKSRSREKIK